MRKKADGLETCLSVAHDVWRHAATGMLMKVRVDACVSKLHLFIQLPFSEMQSVDGALNSPSRVRSIPSEAEARWFSANNIPFRGQHVPPTYEPVRSRRTHSIRNFVNLSIPGALNKTFHTHFPSCSVMPDRRLRDSQNRAPPKK